MTATAKPERAAYDLPLVERAVAEVAPAADVDSSLLLQHAEWFCRLRWLVVGAMLALAGLAAVAGQRLLAAGIRLEAGWPLGIAAALAVANVGYLVVIRVAASSAKPAALAHRGLWLQILVDLAVLTAVVHFLGSVETSAPLMYLCHIVLACIFFPYAEGLAVTAIAMAMYLACVVLETTGVVPPRSVWAVLPAAARGELPLAVLATYVGSVAFISATIWYLASRLAGALRQRDAELAATNRRLMAATDERARHMLQTTHQLKAPFAAIHANTQLLLGGYCGQLPEQAAKIVRQVAERCEMLSREIKAMLQLANLRSSAQSLPPPAHIDLAAALRGCIAAIEPQAGKRNIAIEADIGPAVFDGVQDHVVMMLDNLLTNAVAYSHDGQRVRVGCHAKPVGGAIVSVEDCGIGIAADKLPRIFDDYFRTTEAVQHNKSSTGLGLAIVRQAALAGKVGVHVESAPQQGTVFTLDFPDGRGDSPANS